MDIYGKIDGSLQQIGGKHPGKGWVKMTEQRPQSDMIAQADGTWVLPVSTANEQRAVRDAKIENVRWRIERHQSETRLGLIPTESIAPLDAYIQALRDVPQQPGFPEAVEWPDEPSE
ncbi:hypothetical protein GO013_02485 [Pseudodesulfovibrio sp. JC047]|uniref:phage tail assembly chaperone n=1 Tax=Pseudodesulfovibrio sp. JC047 TaxID=2683199 RepID=UPI0013D8CAC4|nr:phage tail assembly chaperone [Pseudodesulfovibrio sp. JC047]NDV18283.1 hypothetical protein [Pseudodesulfovibrio sp. JC047]